MKNSAKLIAAVLCMVLLCSAFVSCGSEKKETTEESTPASAPTVSQEEEKGIWLPNVENK